MSAQAIPTVNRQNQKLPMKLQKWLVICGAALFIAGVAVSQQKNKRKKGRAVLAIPEVAKKEQRKPPHDENLPDEGLPEEPPERGSGSLGSGWSEMV